MEDSEYYKMKNHGLTIEKIPFDNYNQKLPIKITEKKEINNYIENVYD